MADNACLITVAGSRRRVDVSLPGSLPVAELLWDLVEMLEEPEAAASPPRWALVRVGGRVLDAEQGLAEQGVADGSLLFLRDLASPVQPPAIDDYAEAVALAVEARAGRWTSTVRQWTLVAAAVASAVLAAAAALGVQDLRVRAATSFLAAGLLLASGLLSARRLGQRTTGVLLALGALPLWAVGGAALTQLLGGTGFELAPAIAGFVTVGALLALPVSEEARLPAAAAVAGLGFPAGVAAICLSLGADQLRTAAVLAPLALIAVRQAPGLSVRLAPGLSVRLARLADSRTASQSTLGPRVDTGHVILAALIIGLAVPLAASCAYLAISGGWYERGLAAAVAIGAATHVRHFRFAVEAAPLALAALIGLGALEVAALRQLYADPSLRAAVVGVAVLTALGLAGAGIAGRRRQLSPRLRRRLDQLEAVALAGSIPLAAGSLGVYSAVAALAHRLA
jgi:type VII secretion integral membrane protein EccD